MKKNEKDQSYTMLLWLGTKNMLSKINDDIKPKPKDSVVMVGLKNLGRIGMILFGFLLSPFFVLAFIIAFIVAL